MSRLKSYLFAPAALLCALAMPLSLLAVRTVVLPSLPTGELPNSEVVTNIALDVNSERLICLTFSLELDASTSNGVSIAVGAAAGETLMLEEADFEWGYDCGKWFYADTATGEVEEWTDVVTGRVSRTLSIAGCDFNPLWNRLKITKRGTGDIEIDSSLTVENKKFSIRLR